MTGVDSLGEWVASMPGGFHHCQLVHYSQDLWATQGGGYVCFFQHSSRPVLRHPCKSEPHERPRMAGTAGMCSSVASLDETLQPFSSRFVNFRGLRSSSNFLCNGIFVHIGDNRTCIQSGIPNLNGTHDMEQVKAIFV